MKYPMTPRGYDGLRTEIRKLKAMRPEVAKAIEIARGHGDLSENGDYDAAKAKSGMVEARIRDIEARLSNSQVIDPSQITSHDRVVFGLSVKVEDLASGQKRTLHIYGAEEVDPEKGWVSYEAPLGRCLIGKELNDVATVDLPGGKREYEISEIFCDYSYVRPAEDSPELKSEFEEG